MNSFWPWRFSYKNIWNHGSNSFFFSINFVDDNYQWNIWKPASLIFYFLLIDGNLIRIILNEISYLFIQLRNIVNLEFNELNIF